MVLLGISPVSAARPSPGIVSPLIGISAFVPRKQSDGLGVHGCLRGMKVTFTKVDAKRYSIAIERKYGPRLGTPRPDRSGRPLIGMCVRPGFGMRRVCVQRLCCRRRSPATEDGEDA